MFPLMLGLLSAILGGSLVFMLKAISWFMSADVPAALFWMAMSIQMAFYARMLQAHMARSGRSRLRYEGTPEKKATRFEVRGKRIVVADTVSDDLHGPPPATAPAAPKRQTERTREQA